MVELIHDTNFSIQFVLDKIRGGASEEQQLQKHEDVQQQHQQQWQLINNLESFEAKHIGEGNFMSVILRLELHWKQPCAPYLPSSIIMKVPGPQQIIFDKEEKNGKQQQQNDVDDAAVADNGGISEEENGFIEYLTMAHLREIRFYECFPRFEPSLKLPKFYFGSEYNPSHGEGLILMEDLTTRGATVPVLPGFSDAQVLNLLTEVARIHAVSWRFPEWEESVSPAPINEVFIDMMRENALKLRELDPVVFGPLVDRLLPMFTSSYCALSNYSGQKYGFAASIVHGDLWAPNIIWEKKTDSTGGEEPTDTLCAIIDWQTLHAGNPCEDLHRILSLNTSGPYRRQNEARLLRHYADKVAEFMPNGQAPFSMEQLSESYWNAMPHAMMYLCFGAPFYHEMPSMVGAEGSAERKHNQRELIERTRMFLEDIVKALDEKKICC